MLKRIWIAECDICGERTNAGLTSGRYGEAEPYPPAGWAQGINKNVLICSKCLSTRRINHENGS